MLSKGGPRHRGVADLTDNLGASTVPADVEDHARRCGTGAEDGVSIEMAWIALFAAGLVEIAGALGLKYSDGLSRPLPTLATVAAVVASFALLTVSLRTVPLGTAYAVWTGIGAVGTAALGIALFGESADLARIVSIALIVIGMVGLKIAAQ